MVPLPALLHDTAASYKIRKNRLIAQLKASCSFDVRERWAVRLASWTEHVYRNKTCPSYLLLQCQDEAWLRTCRILIGSFGSHRTLDAGATGTRSSSGLPMRWGDKWLEFVGNQHDGWENPTRNKSLTKQRAATLRQIFLSSDSRGLALEDDRTGTV